MKMMLRDDAPPKSNIVTGGSKVVEKAMMPFPRTAQVKYYVK
jgi:hypothetical protein